MCPPNEENTSSGKSIEIHFRPRSTTTLKELASFVEPTMSQKIIVRRRSSALPTGRGSAVGSDVVGGVSTRTLPFNFTPHVEQLSAEAAFQALQLSQGCSNCVPQLGQNLASSGDLVPQFGQNTPTLLYQTRMTVH